MYGNIHDYSFIGHPVASIEIVILLLHFQQPLAVIKVTFLTLSMYMVQE